MKQIPSGFGDRKPISPLHLKHILRQGELIPWEGPSLDVESPLCDPETGKRYLLGSLPRMDAKAGMLALESAERAFQQGQGEWPSASTAQRVAAAETFIKAMLAVRTEVVGLLMWEIGKPQADAAKEFDRTVDYLRDTIQNVKEMDRNAVRFGEDSGFVAQVRRVPLGVALIMGPYNYPLNETFTTLFPALLMGNTVVFKPAKYGVLLIAPLLEAFRDSFPPGVVNILFGKGRETVSDIMASGRISVLSFIGTSKGANELKKLHPNSHRLRAILGLDAKNPGITLPDADLDLAVSQTVSGALSFNGQRCTALKIQWVHRSLHDEFVNRLVASVEQLKWGAPWDSEVKITALPEHGKVEYLQAMVDDALAHGAQVANPSGAQHSATFYSPTVLTGVTPAMRIYHEEQFGPLVPVVAYDELDEPMKYIMHSNFGQQMSIFGRDPQAIGRLVDACAHQVGRINLNAQAQRGPDAFPFTGRKDSAEGTLSVHDALRAFSIRSMVAFPATVENKELVSAVLRERSSNFLSTDFYL
jgi:glyceraldehyde-3-phosphate dehydrogenase (NADP+)